MATYMSPVRAEDTEVPHSPVESTKKIDDYIQTHPLTVKLRKNTKLTETRPHLHIPKTMRVHNLIAGALAGLHRISIPPYVFSEGHGKRMVMILHLGDEICGHSGIIHGGLLAALMDEGLARCCFAALPNKVGVTASLTITYRQPAMANAFVVLRASTTRLEGRKAWGEGRIETLAAADNEPSLLVEANALFIEPKAFTGLDGPYEAS